MTRALLAALAVALMLVLRAHVTVSYAGAPLVAIPVPWLVLAAVVLLNAAVAWMALRAWGGFRSSPSPRCLAGAS
jgi:hypothetical protein